MSPADQAYQTLEYLNYQTPFGWYLAVHFWGSNGMVLIADPAPDPGPTTWYPRELTWIIGVFLFQEPWEWPSPARSCADQDAYWGLGIGAAIAGRAPLIGPQMVELLLGDRSSPAEPCRAFCAACLCDPRGADWPGCPASLVGAPAGYQRMAGAGPPGRSDRIANAGEAEVQRDGVPFFPVAAQKDMVGMALVVAGVSACAALFGPGPRGVPDPTLINTAPLPDFYFLALYALFALLPPWTETVVILVGPVVAIVLLLALPFLAGTGERAGDAAIAVVSVLRCFDCGHACRSRDHGALVS